MGDGALVYFGYPEAHEDDAERAVRAGLALIDAMAAMPLSVPLRPQVRVGIATGLVVVGELIGEGSAQERVAVGETLNLAARIQAVASPDSVVVPELTRRLAGAAFDYEELGQHELKGIRDVARLWRVVGGKHCARTLRSEGCRRPYAAGRSRRGDHASPASLGPREGGRWPARPSLGAAGFGKSRMTQAFREDLDDPSVICLQYFGSPFHVNSAFYPFIGSSNGPPASSGRIPGPRSSTSWRPFWKAHRKARPKPPLAGRSVVDSSSANAIRRCSSPRRSKNNGQWRCWRSNWLSFRGGMQCWFFSRTRTGSTRPPLS